MLPSLISPETAKFSAEEAPSHSVCRARARVRVCVSVCREIKRVPRKAGVQPQPSNKDGSGGSSARPRADLLHNDGAFAEKQGRNCNFLTEETDVTRPESRSRSLGGKLVVVVKMKNTTTPTIK